MSRLLRRYPPEPARGNLVGSLEILNGALVLFRGGPGFKRAEILSFTCFRVLFSGIQPVLATG